MPDKSNKLVKPALENDTEILEAEVSLQDAGKRLDQLAVEMFPQYSRSRLQSWIKDGKLTLDGRVVKPKAKVVGGELLKLLALQEQQCDWQPEPIPLDVVYEDECLLVLNKAAGMVVHPAVGNYNGTLLNGLLHFNPVHSTIPRAGIVHRLDKDTSGIMVVAKSCEAQLSLVDQLQKREVRRHYQAVAVGRTDPQGHVNAPIGRHPSQRTKMAVIASGKEARTHFNVRKYFRDFTHLELKLETGRTHQIRVHMAYLGYPLLGDDVYGKKLPAKLLRSSPLAARLANFPRQALHAFRLGLRHPNSGEAMEWEIPLPDDMQGLLDLLAELEHDV